MIEINGRQATAEDMRALGLYNYGHFTSMRVERMRVRGLALHLERLSRDARALFGVELDTDRVRYLVRAFAERMESPAIARVTVFDSDGAIDRPGQTSEPDILVSARHAPQMADISPLRVESVHYQRELPAIKHVGLFGSLNCRRSAQFRGYDDALFIDSHSHVTEGPTWNIGFFDGTQILWPKADVLPGVTLNLLRGIASGSGLTSVENVIHISQVSETWAAFATNAGVGVRPIQAIDEVELVSSSSVLRNLQLQYAAIPGEAL
jgi:branched-subunit amino acid aminotransferase/4-amino-4-deoxychorismate lyase